VQARQEQEPVLQVRLSWMCKMAASGRSPAVACVARFKVLPLQWAT